jgi:excinuclease ABC subunit B
VAFFSAIDEGVHLSPFDMRTPFVPQGDQPAAIAGLVDGLEKGERYQVLLGVTGSGKTFTMANVIERVQRPTLVLAPNKTLAAQLYSEFRDFFPSSAVEYFVSYYDYYQPEAYIPSTDTYIEKDSSINDEIDRLRHSATSALLSRDDVIIVASVSCVYGLGSPDEYMNRMVMVEEGGPCDRDAVIRKLVDIRYDRNDLAPDRGDFRVRGDIIDVFPAYRESDMVRIELFDDVVERITEVNPITGEVTARLNKAVIWPATHFLTPGDQLRKAIVGIQEELRERLKLLESQNKLLEAQRLKSRTMYDVEMLEHTGFCHGIENYSRHFSRRLPGEAPPTLLDYLPQDALMVIDESHQTIPQVHGMYHGDRSRKETLVNYGFRLPSALDNRPLTFEEFENRVNQVIYVSATPGPYELKKSAGVVVEQVIRPTGLVDPEVEVRPIKGQVDDLLNEIRKRVEAGERVLVTTLTKRMSEDLAEYYSEVGVKCQYLHSEVATLDRVKVLRDLRRGDIDVLIGVNLLREGLDLPEVSLVAILDADKEGFLRSSGSLIQTMGRAARNLHGKAVLYADVMTESMRTAIGETNRRRKIQVQYNEDNNITPQSIIKPIDMSLVAIAEADYVTVPLEEEDESEVPPEQLERYIGELEQRMREAAKKFEFEQAAQIRDRVKALKAKLV